MELNPQGINGNWRSGIVLDWHTINSVCIGENEFGYPIFETTRSEIGELMYRFKYRNDTDALRTLLATACKYLVKAKGKFDLIAAVPPSNPRRKITSKLARGLAHCLSGEYANAALTKRGSTEELKSIDDPDRRKEILAGAFSASQDIMGGKSVLLVDDLYRSGSTLEAATQAAYEEGQAKVVYVFAVTRTRVNR